jgi:hypothetical protein
LHQSSSRLRTLRGKSKSGSRRLRQFDGVAGSGT